MKELDVFIEGETMDLCIPTEEFAKDSNWYSWFNDKRMTRFLDQGLFPNTQDDQLDFYRSQKDRLMLIVSNKKTYMGIVSISNIDLIKKTGFMSVVIDGGPDLKMAPFIALEAVARITEHGINTLGLNRIDAGQHVDLSRWRQRMELLGYKVEGLHEGKFIKGREVSDAMSLACTYESFQDVVSHRGGVVWDSMQSMKNRQKKLPKCDFSETLMNLFESERKNYYKKIFLL